MTARIYFLAFNSKMILWLRILSWTPLVSPKYTIYIPRRDNEHPLPLSHGSTMVVKLVLGHIGSARSTTRPHYILIHLLLAEIPIYTALIWNVCQFRMCDPTSCNLAAWAVYKLSFFYFHVYRYLYINMAVVYRIDQRSGKERCSF